MELEILDCLSQEQFVLEHIAANQPCVIKDAFFQSEHWTTAAVRDRVGDLSTQVYDTLFDLQDITTLNAYMEKYFGRNGPVPNSVPYVRWYNRLKDVEFAWGDEAFERLATCWTLPDCIPRTDFLVPVSGHQTRHSPVVDLFPYRGVLVAAKGARTRLHRDPFCSDAIVNQFAGVKEFMLYRPERSDELMLEDDRSSFGGFTDVRSPSGTTGIEPDYAGRVGPGELLYIPHGWLHDVLVIEDSISITWNFVHRAGSAKFLEYLQNTPESDPEFEVLRYFYAQAGHAVESAQHALDISHPSQPPESRLAKSA